MDYSERLQAVWSARLPSGVARVLITAAALSSAGCSDSSAARPSPKPREPSGDVALTQAASRELPASRDAASSTAAGSAGSARFESRNRTPLCLATQASFKQKSPYDTVMFVKRELLRVKGKKPLKVAAGEQLQVVFQGACLSTCDHDGQHLCTVEQVGSELRLTSALSHLRGDGEHCTEGGSTAPCHPAICRTPKLAAGSYTLVYGARELAFNVPGELDRFCLPGN
jgi:hypothetical protein